MKKILFFILLLISPISQISSIESINTPDTVTDAVDSTEMLMLDDLIDPADTLDISLNSYTPELLNSYTLTDLDCRLVDWALEWLDTTACESTPKSITLTDEEVRTKLRALPCVIEMPYNAVVRKYIDPFSSGSSRFRD